MIEISVSNLEKVLSALLTSFKERGISKFQFKNNFYWSVPEEELVNLNKTPQLHVGSLADDISFLNSLVEEDYDANLLELERLSALFKAISYQLTLE